MLDTLLAVTVVVHVSVAVLFLIVNAYRAMERRALPPPNDAALRRELSRHE